jgi:SH3 domain protein
MRWLIAEFSAETGISDFMTQERTVTRRDLGTMTKLLRIIVLATLGLSVMAQASWASKAYVTDSFRISLRRGPSIENKILRFVPSGLPVEVVQETQDGWSRVRLLEAEDGILEGWVLNRYLVKRLPWEDQAKSLMEENARLKKSLATVDQKWGEKVRREQGLSQELKEDFEEVTNRAQRLTEENELLRSSKRKKWFTTGGLVLLSGLVVGLLLGKPPKRRRLSYR